MKFLSLPSSAESDEPLSDKSPQRSAIDPEKQVDVNDLFPQTKGTHTLLALRYPMYSAEEKLRYRQHPFWYTCDKGQLLNRAIGSPGQILAPQEKGIALIHESTAKAGYFQSYLRELMGYSPEITAYARNYRQRVRELCAGKIAILPAPYIPEAIGADIKYASDPDIITCINNKDHLADFVPKDALPKRKTGVPLNTKWVQKTMDAEGLDYPVVLKGGGGGNSGGNAVRIAENPDEIKHALTDLAKQKCNNVTVEEYFEHDSNTNVQLVISDDDIKFFGISEQVVAKNGSYGGNLYNFSEARNPHSLPQNVWDACMDSAKKMQQCGYRGLVGLDVLYKADSGEVRIIDPNARINGSTPALALMPRILKNITVKATEMEFVRATVRAAIDEVMNHMRDRLEKGEAFMIGGASEGDVSKIYILLPGEAEERQLLQTELNEIRLSVSGLEF